MDNTKKKKPFYKRAWFIVLAIVVVIGAVSSMGDGDESNNGNNTGNTSSTEETADNGTEEPAEEPTDVTSDELINLLSDNALKATNTYKDKYVRLTGKLSNIDAQGNYFSLSSVNDEYSMDTIMCNIEEEHLDQVMNFQDGQEVVVVGTITDVGEIMGYTLDVKSIE